MDWWWLWRVNLGMLMVGDDIHRGLMMIIYQNKSLLIWWWYDDWEEAKFDDDGN